MSELMSDLIQALDTARSAEEVNRVSSRIAKIGEPAIPDLLKYAKTLYPRPGSMLTIMRILHTMGYPANQSTIPFMVNEASNINSSGWEIALNDLVKIGEPAIPEVHNALQFYMKDLDEYQNEIQGLAILLKLMGSPLIDPLLPDLLRLLEAGTDENHVDEYALWPLRKIGSPKADAALEQISKIISSRRSKGARKAAIDALIDFDPSAIRFLVPILRDCRFDDEEGIRNSAEKILKVLGAI